MSQSETNDPEHISRFLAKCIDSVEQLQVLLLLHSDAKKLWSIDAITKELQSTPTSVEKRLSDLYMRKVLIRDKTIPGFHRFYPYNDDIQKAVDDLAEFNRKKQFRVIELIYSRPTEALKAFADAFRLKKD